MTDPYTSLILRRFLLASFTIAGLAVLAVLLAATLSSVLASSPGGDDEAARQAEWEARGPELMNIRLDPPDGEPAISEEEAMAAAREAAPGLEDRASSVKAEYVLMSKDDTFDMLPDGTREYVFQDRPVWIVTYSGLELPSRSGYSTIVNTELHKVIDAQTGEALYSFSYR